MLNIYSGALPKKNIKTFICISHELPTKLNYQYNCNYI